MSFRFSKWTRNFANDFVLGNERYHVERASALTLQRVDLIDAFDELRPTFSESGALFWRELGLGLGCGVVVVTEGVKREAALFPEKPRPRSVGSKIVNAVFSRLWNLGEDSCDELENVEALAFGMGKQRLVMGAFALVEQSLGTGRPMNA